MDPTLVPAETALEMITIEGARAVLAEGSLGSIEEGKRADLTLHDTSGPEWAPGHDVVRTLVYSADGRSVRTVVVDGAVIHDDGHSARFDERDVIDTAREAAARIASRLGLDPRARWPLEGPDARLQSG